MDFQHHGYRGGTYETTRQDIVVLSGMRGHHDVL